jgi:hypothetical protein
MVVIEVERLIDMADKISTKRITRVKNTPVLRLAKELKWVGIEPNEEVFILKIGDVLVIKRK